MNELNFKKSLVTFLNISFSIFICTNSFAANTVYSCKDDKGNMVFTDAPENNPNCINPKAKELDPITSLPTIGNAVTPRKRFESDANADQKRSEAPSYTITFIEPASGATINRCGGSFDIKYSIEPELEDGDKLEVYLDGSMTGLNLSGLNPGNHTLDVNITRENSIIARQSVSFYFTRNCARKN